MQLKWLEDFLAYSATRSFTRAAEMRNVTHPAFGRRLRALEHWMGVPLFDRGSFPATITPDGQRLLEVARDVSVQLNDLRAELRRKRSQDGRAITIATGRTLARTRFPDLHQRLVTQAPHLLVRLLTTSLADGIQMLADEAIDFLLFYDSPAAPIPLDKSEYSSVRLGHETLIAVCGPDAEGRPRFRRDARRPRRIPYLAYPNTMALGRALDARLEQLGEQSQFERVFEADMAETLLDATHLGRGVAWLPGRLVESDIASGRLVRFEDPETDVSLDVKVCKHSRSRSLAVQSAWRTIESYAAISDSK
ncbi:MAG: LysR family transcriptional regulator [Rhizobiales bacterium]|nr:LysR family transcriptional regulator [Hyphomicrobiales bacterium]